MQKLHASPRKRTPKFRRRSPTPRTDRRASSDALLPYLNAQKMQGHDMQAWTKVLGSCTCHTLAGTTSEQRLTAQEQVLATLCRLRERLAKLQRDMAEPQGKLLEAQVQRAHATSAARRAGARGWRASVLRASRLGLIL